MNVELLERVKQHILEEPKRLDMSDWIQVVDPEDPGNPKCGTKACIAGWACLISGEFLRLDQVRNRAQALLELDEYEAERLFMPNYATEWPNGEDDEEDDEIVVGWPEEFADEYDEALSDTERAAITADRIDHFIKTKGRE